MLWPLVPRPAPLRSVGVAAAGVMLAVTAACSGEAPATGASDVPSAPVTDRRVGSSVGDLAPDFTVETVDGETVTLSELRGQGKSVLLYFFASW